MRHPRTFEHPAQLPIDRSGLDIVALQALLHRSHTGLERPRDRLSTAPGTRTQLIRASRPISALTSPLLRPEPVVSPANRIEPLTQLDNDYNGCELHHWRFSKPSWDSKHIDYSSTAYSHPTIATRSLPFRLFCAH